MLKLVTPNGSQNVLLHACCAPCSGAILECMIENGLKPVVFFSNSNIDSKEEYDKRLEELRRYTQRLGLELVDDTYNHQAWLEAVRGFENEAERGPRCLLCFKYRLSRAAAFARKRGLDLVTTSLASSRWKSLEQVNSAGAEVCPDLFWAQNWRRGGLQERRNQIIKEEGFYNQTWCGCEFSK